MNSLSDRERGTAMVEFAIVLPLLVMLVFGITELGRAMFQLNTITKAAVTGARYLARLNGVVDVTYDEASGQAVSCASGTNWASATAAVSNLIVYGNEAGEGEPKLPGMEVTFDPPPQWVSVSGGGYAAAGCVVTVEVRADFISVFGGDHLIPFTGIEPITLGEIVQERYIGE